MVKTLIWVGVAYVVIGFVVTSSQPGNPGVGGILTWPKYSFGN